MPQSTRISVKSVGATGFRGWVISAICLMMIPIKGLFFVESVAGQTLDTDDMRIVLATPGPRSLTYLPADIMSHIGADTAEHVTLRLVQYGGGGPALEQLHSRNADFAMVGMPAAMWSRAGGGPVVTVAAVSDLPVFVLVARSALGREIHTVADLRGRTIGVASSSLAVKTTSQQLTELLLAQAGVPLSSVRIIPAGQSWVEQSSVILSGHVDAMMGNEPFTERLRQSGLVFYLANTADPAVSKALPGGGFLMAALHTRPDIIERQPDKVARMVCILRRTLEWMATHTPEEVAQASGATDPIELSALTASIRAYPRLYSRDARLSTAQLRETDAFYSATAALNGGGATVTAEAMSTDRWSGRKD